MSIWLKQSTAVTVPMGPFVDDTDFKTVETGLSLTQAETRLSKNGGAFAQKNDATTASHMEEGTYGIVLNATDTNTLGRLRIQIQVAGALIVWQDFMVVPANVWDSFFGADKLQVHADEITAGLITAAAIATGAIDADAIAADAITAAKVAADVSAEIADAVWDEDATGHQSQGSFGQAIGDPGADSDTIFGLVNTNLDAAVSSRASQASVDTIDGIVDAILVDTGTTLQGELDGIQADTEDIQSRLPAALVGGRIDANVGAISGDATAADNLESYTDGTTPMPVNATQISGDATAADNLEAALDGTGGVTIEANLDGNVTGSVGSVTGAVGSVTGNVGGNVTGSVGSLAAQAKADVNAEVDTALTDIHLDHLLAADYDPASKPGTATALLNELVENDGGVSRFTANALEQGPGGGSAPTAAEIADAVWEEAIADHSGTSGSTAEALNAAGAAGDPWTTQLPGAYGAGSAGKIVGDNLNATVSSRASQSSVDTVDGVVDAILADTGTDGVVVAAASKSGYSLSAAGIQAIWDALTSALTTASSIGKLLVDNINATIGSRLASASYTAPLDAAGTRAAVGLAAANLDTQLDALPTAAETASQVRTELATELARIDAAVSTRATPAQVNAEVLDVLETDTFAEPAGVPAATSSLKDKLAWLFALGRNKVTQTSTTQTLRNDADSADIATASVSDDGTTFTKGEWS